MNSKKKITSLCLIIVFVITSLSACSKKQNSEVVTPTTVTTPEDTKTPSQGTKVTPVTSEGTQKYPPMPIMDIDRIDDNYRTYYEVFLYTFYDSNQDGIGDINGLISKLDYLNDNDPTTDTDLGVTGIWLMPIMPSDTYHKYDVKDFYEIDPSYGTLDDFKRLVEECEKRDIKIIIDFIFNHTSNNHPWFQEAARYLRGLEQGQEPDVTECKYIEYYNFAKDMADKSGYRKLDNTNWYYEGVFVTEMPDLKLDNPEVRAELETIAKFWLDLGVHGFRLDAAKEYYSGVHTKNIEVLSWFNSYVKEVNPNAYIVGEVWDSFGTIASYYESGIDSVFNYAFGDSEGKIAMAVKNAGNNKVGYNLALNMKQVADIYKQRNENYIDASFISNHDNNRAASFVGGNEDLVKLMGGINLMMSGSSFMYYGEEVGMMGTGRDENKRAPMHWSITDLSGMTKGPARMEKQVQSFEPVDEQQNKDDSILNYYKRAIRIRNQNPEISRGEIEVLEGLDKNISAVKKTYQEKSIIILMNINPNESIVTLSKEQYGYEGIEAALTTTSLQPTIVDNEITLPPYAIVVLQ